MSTDDTKARLLEAAGEEFGEHGFQGATVRAISARAGVNLAAVNYHFGDKYRLYEQALIEAFRWCMRDVLEPPPRGAPPEAQLRHHIQHFLRNILAVGRRDDDWQHKLLSRELLRPTKAAETLVRELIRPRFSNLGRIVRQFRPDLEGRALYATIFSIVGQCMYYRFGRTIAERLVGPRTFATLDVEFLTEHITVFTLGALAAGAPGGTRTGGEAP